MHSAHNRLSRRLPFSQMNWMNPMQQGRILWPRWHLCEEVFSVVLGFGEVKNRLTTSYDERTCIYTTKWMVLQLCNGWRTLQCCSSRTSVQLLRTSGTVHGLELLMAWPWSREWKCYKAGIYHRQAAKVNGSASMGPINVPWIVRYVQSSKRTNRTFCRPVLHHTKKKSKKNQDFFSTSSYSLVLLPLRNTSS